MPSEFQSYGIDDFMELFMPNNHLAALEPLLKDLKKQKVLAPRVRSGVRTTSPSTGRPVYSHSLRTFKTSFGSSTINPKRVLKSLQTAWNAVRRSLHRAKSAPVNACSISLNGSLGGCVTTSPEGPRESTNVVMPLRFITRDPDHDDEREISPGFIADIESIMKEDARRTFVRGITIENDMLSLWYASRSHTAQSVPFSMVNHPDLVVAAFASLICATPAGLGYDQKVTLLSDQTYVYELPPDTERTTPAYFKTIHLLSDREASIHRARVWRVKRVVSNSDLRRVPGTRDEVLKDVYVDEHAKTEADIQDDLFHDIASFARNEDWRSHVLLKDLEKEDLDPLESALEGENFKHLFLRIVAKHLNEPGDPLLSGKGNRRRRCQFVYEDVATALYNIPTLGEAIEVIKHCVLALRLMFCAGWVHRDVSPGNILAVKLDSTSGWKVKISDLEYATRFPRQSSSEVTGDDHIRGTPSFMACEVQRGSYWKESKPTGGRRGRQKQSSTEDAPTHPVIHSYQHDLESLWWIILWLIAMRRRDGADSRALTEHLFQQTMDTGYISMRWLFFKEGLDELSTAWWASFPSILKDDFLPHLDDLRGELLASYTQRNEANSVMDVESYSWVTGVPLTLFFAIVDQTRAQWGGIEMDLRDAPTDDSPPTPALEQDVHPLPPPSHQAYRVAARKPKLTIGRPAVERTEGPRTRSMTKRMAENQLDASHGNRSKRPTRYM
ncbi:other/FunK1 protein kinase [Coprinopsis cinerea AmutBmut pab1-1]|nr:other/FunK1 protein kinase [Coprinopsis cinerea AmutBmut pab1-1]